MRLAPDRRRGCRLNSHFRAAYNRGALSPASPPPLGAAPGVSAVLVQMELARIIISDMNDQQIVYLREIEGQRSFPILIGIFEAASINRHVKGEESQRPLTHDLLRNVIEQMGGELQDVVI